jgi:hypothetical protein
VKLISTECLGWRRKWEFYRSVQFNIFPYPRPPVGNQRAYRSAQSFIQCGRSENQKNGRNAAAPTSGVMAPFPTAQHAGPKLTGYASTITTTASVHFAHRSRRLMIRTVSQMQKAANATAKAGSSIIMPGC